MKNDDAAAAAPALDAPERRGRAGRALHLHMPVDVRNLALVVIAVMLSLYVLHWAKAVVVPVLLGVMFSYALSPAIDRLERWRAAARRRRRAAADGDPGRPRRGWAGPSATSRRPDRDPARGGAEAAQGGAEARPATWPSTLEKVQQAATEIERATEETALPTTASGVGRLRRGLGGAGARPRAAAPRGVGGAARVEPMSTSVPPTPRGVTRVVIEKPRINVKEYLWTGTLGLVTLAGQATLVVFITFFLLASGNTFRRKMVKLAGPRLSQKKITVQALDEVHEQIQRYLFVQMATSVVVGVLSGWPSGRSASTTRWSGASSPASPTSFPISARW